VVGVGVVVGVAIGVVVGVGVGRVTDARRLASVLTLAALACLLAVSLWPEPVCRACGVEVLRERASMEGPR